LVYKGEESGFFDIKGETVEQLRNSVSAQPSTTNAATGGEVGETNLEEEKVSKAPLRNQFNFSERAAQTVNNPYRVRVYD
jgi:dynein intermediate chain 1